MNAEPTITAHALTVSHICALSGCTVRVTGHPNKVDNGTFRLTDRSPANGEYRSGFWQRVKRDGTLTGNRKARNFRGETLTTMTEWIARGYMTIEGFDLAPPTPVPSLTR